MSFMSTSFSQRVGASTPTAPPASAPVASPIASPVAPVPVPNTATPKNESTLSVEDKKEIHYAKAGASMWSSLIGPFKPLWDFLFYNPERAAMKRLDVKSEQRTLLSGEALEAEKKKAQLKASLVPSILAMTLLFGLRGLGNIAALIAPLSYILFEKPEAPDFNEKL